MLFYVKNITATRVNLIMNDYVAGLPSPLAFLGLADTVARKVGIEPWSAGVLPVLHSVVASEGRTKPEMEAKSGTFRPVETLEDMTGIVTFSMLLDLPGFESAAQLRQILPALKLGGGIFQDHTLQGHQLDEATPDGSAFRNFNRGFALLPTQQDGLRVISSGDTAALAKVAQTVFPKDRQPGSGWIVPVAVGHHLIEDPDTVPYRRGKRDHAIPHVFTEPVLGIAEMVSVRNPILTGATPDQLAAKMWRWHAAGSHVVGHSTYHPATLPNTKAA
jgi:hypothetical protein|tara:strand:- start:46245 stop:47069 length:825 start_codon:yes stop_codon:yes gene_type:complete